MNSKQFLLIGGIVMALLGILGMVNVLGPTSGHSLLGAHLWFDKAESWSYLVLGVIGLIAAFALPAAMQKYLVILFGIVGLLLGLYSLFIGNNFLGAHLEKPADTILTLALGLWALWAAMRKAPMAMQNPNPMM